MTITLETIHQDMQKIKSELTFLRHIMEEECELSDETKRRLEKARQDMNKGKYISHEDIKAKYG
jgi:AraC-like DNA-binding protein